MNDAGKQHKRAWEYPELHISIGNEVSDLYNLTALRRAVYY
mgnify:CR=1 FL=1